MKWYCQHLSQRIIMPFCYLFPSTSRLQKPTAGLLLLRSDLVIRFLLHLPLQTLFTSSDLHTGSGFKLQGWSIQASFEVLLISGEGEGEGDLDIDAPSVLYPIKRSILE
ncbi:hypothetical protein L6452_13277 [Arctium lappa]|uniref:Uncharacterized protein n=1 Tax=Arctium lappa TaxID=4217 RepID=A0ACB9CI28_ARCLA|nr:hypothetical protein L6452_13277 [Arctium lappa]